MDQATAISMIVAAGTVCGIVFGYVGYSRGAQKDSFSEGIARGTQEADTSYIRKRVWTTYFWSRKIQIAKLEGHAIELSEHVVEIVCLEESAKSAHKRIDT